LLALTPGQSAEVNSTAPQWTAVEAPAELSAPEAQWIKIETASGHRVLAAVFRPEGIGPFPVVVVFHGAGGLVPVFLSLAQDLAREGFVAVAGCWQAISSSGARRPGLAAREPNPVCAEAPPQALWQDNPAKHSGQELIAAARTLRDVTPDRVGLYGLSRGGHAVLWDASTGVDVQAIVLDAGSHHPTWLQPAPPSTLSVIDGLAAPTLMLQGTEDRSSPVEQAREYERAARARSKPLTAVYFEGMGHLVTVMPSGAEPQTLADVRSRTVPEARRRAIAFLREHLNLPASKP
jgi:dienelactone hydrolase